MDKKARIGIGLVVATVVVAAAVFGLAYMETHVVPANRQRRAPENAAREWAEPVEMEGVPNLHKVSDDLYRGAQPTEHGVRNLKEMGIETIVNLRLAHSDRDEIGDTGVSYIHIRMAAWNAEDEDTVRFLRIVTDPERTPVFLHCKHGADRTGTLAAVYRMAVQGWSAEEAIEEMTKGGFDYHEIWDNLPEYLRDLDVNALRAKAGLPPLDVASAAGDTADAETSAQE